MSSDSPLEPHTHTHSGSCCDGGGASETSSSEIAANNTGSTCEGGVGPHRHARLDEASLATFRAAAAEVTNAAGPNAPPPAHRVVLLRDVVDSSSVSEAESVEWVGTQGLKITLLGGLTSWTRLRALRLRSNLIASTAGLRGVLLGGLEELELYDNLLRELEDFGPGGAPALRELDIAYNKITTLDGLVGAAPLLRVLLAAGNRLRGPFPGVALAASATSLIRLDLGANGLTCMTGLGVLTSLEELWLGKNRITQLDHAELTPLIRLRILDVQSNRLTSIEGLPPSMPSLEEFYIAHNGIGDIPIAALQGCPRLTTIDVTGNPLPSLAFAAAATTLEDVWAGYTRVATFSDALDGLRALPALRTLYLEHSIVAKDWEYRLRIARDLPRLTQLDADAIRRA